VNPVISTPSFFRLFKRSSYRTPAITQAPEPSDFETDVRTERERFATAAVAFCLKHSLEFRTHFWRSICSFEKEPALVPELEVFLEPPHWADLRLVTSKETVRRIWIIEFKIDSDLADKQNPAHADAFCAPNSGYGALMRNWPEANGAELNYVVLGSKKLHGNSDDHSGKFKELGINWQAKRWKDLSDRAPTDSLTADLFAALGQLGVERFRMSEIKQIKITGNADWPAQAWDVVKAIGGSDECNFRWRVRAYADGPDQFYVGADIDRLQKKSQGSKIHRDLNDIYRRGTKIGWVGYEALPKPEGFRRCVYLYSASHSVIESLKDKFYPEGNPSCSLTVSPISTDPYVRVFKNIPSAEPDFDWFLDVLKHAAEP
jgi:hypothetical protein